MVRWGILGCGKIANKFAECFSDNGISDSTLHGCAARDLSRAEIFANNHEIPKFYGSYEELVNSSEIDAVYIATPHSHHKEHAQLCLNNNKAVMCEKAFTINTREALDVIELARNKNLFLMEAMWMRFLPTMAYLRKIIEDNELGRPIRLNADFSFKGSNNVDGRLLNPDLAGGALLDVGIYPLSLSLMVFEKEPEEISGSAQIGDTNIDESNTMELKFSSGQSASLTSSVVSDGTKQASIEFENGKVEIPLFWRSESLEIAKEGEESLEEQFPFRINGFEYEIQEAVDCIKSGKKESDTMPLSETIKTLKVMDNIRAKWGLTYPMEK